MASLLRHKITQSLVKEFLHYNPRTGIWTWIKRKGRGVPGMRAGNLNPDGYRYIRICGVPCAEHRLAWLYMKGSWPDDELDHKNLVKGDNRWKNLREATHRQNSCNTKIRSHSASGLKGVYRYKNLKSKPYNAYIRVNRERRSLGYYETAEEAHAAYCRAAGIANGEFARAE